jgi:hypothetical protein
MAGVLGRCRFRAGRGPVCGLSVNPWQALADSSREGRNRRCRAGFWPELVARYPGLGETQAKTARQIPVIALTRVDRRV